MGDVIDDERRPLISASASDNEPNGCGSSALCDPRQAVHRYFVLIFLCFLSFGNQLYDISSVLKELISDYCNR